MLRAVAFSAIEHPQEVVNLKIERVPVEPVGPALVIFNRDHAAVHPTDPTDEIEPPVPHAAPPKGRHLVQVCGAKVRPPDRQASITCFASLIPPPKVA